MNTQTEKPAMVYRATLKSRFGLTDKLIRMLGEADECVPNPHYKSGPPAGLYAVARVEDFLKGHQAEVAEAEAKRGRRKEAAARAVETKVRKVVSFVKSVELKVMPLPKTFAELKGIARHYAYERYGADAHSPGYNGVVATVRHEFTNYHAVLAAFEGRVGAGRELGGSPAYNALRARLDEEVDRAIRDAYPSEFDSGGTGLG
jgi:hypothetical protein